MFVPSRKCVDALLPDRPTPVSKATSFAEFVLYLLRYFTLTTLLAMIVYAYSSVMRANLDLVFVTTFVALYSTFVLTNAVIRVRLKQGACDNYLESMVTHVLSATLHIGMWFVGVWLHTVRFVPPGGRSSSLVFHYAMDLRTLKTLVAVALFVALSEPQRLYFPSADENPDTRYEAIRRQYSDVVMLLASLAMCLLLWAISTMAGQRAGK